MEPQIRAAALLKDLKEKVITVMELREACARWTAEIIEEFKWKAVPEKPQYVIDHELAHKFAKEPLDKTFWTNHPQLAAYYDVAQNVHHEKQATYDWFKECLSVLPTGDAAITIAKAMRTAPRGVKK